MDQKPLPIGYDDFKKLISEGYYYVDKTWLIKELLDKKGEVTLFTRPRRFGKTLNMSMLRYFFEDTGDEDTNEENRRLFWGMKIMEAGDKYLSHMNGYPVISLSLKSSKQPSWELAFLMLKRQIAQEYERHQQIMKSLETYDFSRYQRILQQTGEMGDYIDALAFLSKCLESYYHKPVIVLIDEYDVPLENAYFSGFYQTMADYIRSLFESVLKTNSSLYFAVITGCLRITKESIFTGLNNLEIISIISKSYEEYFGFTQDELTMVLQDYQIENKQEMIRQWYDGYVFGNTQVYNPWSIVNYVKALSADPMDLPKVYWSNTSSNSIIRTLIDHADASARFEIENLIAGGTIDKPVHEDITYEDVYTSMDNLWNFLFFTGYLTKTEEYMADNKLYLKFSIPNIEIQEIYKDKIRGWFEEKTKETDMTGLYQAMWDMDTEALQEQITSLLQETISFYDHAEAFYHGFMLGILSRMRTCIIKSNRESGNGRYDILIQNMDQEQPVIIWELKTARSFGQMESMADLALQQIQEKEYDTAFAQEGYTTSIRYGIAFYKKRCRIKGKRVFFEM